MGSEKNLWKRIDDAVGMRGHFDRREYNPIDGVPDLSFCVQGVEGHMELKYMDDPPVRDSTAVFGPRTNKGMRDEQVAWAIRRLRAGGRTYIMAQVGKMLYLFHGGLASRFNEMTVPDMRMLALWKAGPLVKPAEWERFLLVLQEPFDATWRWTE